MLANAAGMALMCVRPRPDPNPHPKPPVNRRHLVNSFQEKLQLVRLVPDGKGRAPELHRDGLNALPTKYQCSEFFFFLACPGLWCITHFHFAFRKGMLRSVIFPLPSVAKLKVSFNLSAFRRTERWERFSDFAIDCALIPAPAKTLSRRISSSVHLRPSVISSPSHTHHKGNIVGEFLLRWPRNAGPLC